MLNFPSGVSKKSTTNESNAAKTRGPLSITGFCAIWGCTSSSSGSIYKSGCFSAFGAGHGTGFPLALSRDPEWMLARPAGLQMQHGGRAVVLLPTPAFDKAANSKNILKWTPSCLAFQMVPWEGELGASAAFGALETRTQRGFRAP